MRPTTVRRLLVFTVCACGVGALYWVPALAGAPVPTGSGSQLQSELPRKVVVTATTTATATVSTDPADTSNPPSALPTTTAPPPTEPELSVAPPKPAPQPTQWVQQGATAWNPVEDRDRQRPGPVPDVEVTATTEDTLTVRWGPASDDVRVVSYRVWLNGFEVASTAELEATVEWFNDDSGINTVQVTAMDAAGHQSAPSLTVLASRPTAEPVPTTEPVPTPSPTPRATPAPSTPGATPAPSTATQTPTPSPTTSPTPSTWLSTSTPVPTTSELS
ncbi:MAG TPA: hypothetical protein VFP89_02685 [Propionibacteriaceae bacterium]|nr:hypothetical protein [Propionibacteriaceae bacterium]